MLVLDLALKPKYLDTALDQKYLKIGMEQFKARVSV